MTNTREPALPAQEISRYWLRVLRVSASTSLLLVALSSYFLEGKESLMICALFVGYYLMVLLGVRGTPLRGALQLARLIGMLGFVITLRAVWSFYSAARDYGSGLSLKFTSFSMGIALTQLIVTLSASKTLSSMRGAIVQETRLTWVVGLAAVMVFFFLFVAALVLPGLLSSIGDWFRLFFPPYSPHP